MDFSRLTEYMDTLRQVGVPGCDLAIYRDHEPIYRHLAGCCDADAKMPMRGDELYNLYSCTKVFTTCAAMQLIERDLMGLDDPVADYLPAFGKLTVRVGDIICPASRTMTIRHLMSMQGGLDYEMETPAILEALARSGGKADARELMEAKAGEPLCFEPGTDFLYSLCHDVLAAVIEVVAGVRFSVYLKQNLFEPLNLQTTGFAAKDPARLCAQFIHMPDGRLEVVPPESNRFFLSPNYESGGAGLISDVMDCITFADALACGGVSVTGRQIISPETMQLWRANQLCPKARTTFDEWHRLGYSYALGVRTRVLPNAGGRGQVGEFGWDGAAGAWMMIDPYNRLSAFFAMHVRDFGYAFDVIHPRLRDLIYGGLDMN